MIKTLYQLIALFFVCTHLQNEDKRKCLYTLRLEKRARGMETKNV